MVYGLISGPGGCFLALLLATSRDVPWLQGWESKETAAFLLLVFTLAAALILGGLARTKVPRSARASLRVCASIGIVAPILWIVIIVGLIIAALHNIS
jgi:hypothetical protein